MAVKYRFRVINLKAVGLRHMACRGVQRIARYRQNPAALVAFQIKIRAAVILGILIKNFINIRYNPLDNIVSGQRLKVAVYCGKSYSRAVLFTQGVNILCR